MFLRLSFLIFSLTKRDLPITWLSKRQSVIHMSHSHCVWNQGKREIVGFDLGHTFVNKNTNVGVDFCRIHFGKDKNAQIWHTFNSLPSLESILKDVPHGESEKGLKVYFFLNILFGCWFHSRFWVARSTSTPLQTLEAMLVPVFGLLIPICPEFSIGNLLFVLEEGFCVWVNSKVIS